MSRGATPNQVVKPQVLVRIAFKNLFFKRLRTSLTILGVVIGIGSIVFLLSLGSGLQKLVASQVIGSKSVKTIDVSTPKAKSVKLDAERLAAFASLAGVEKVAKVYFSSGKVGLDASQTDAVVYGASQSYIDLSSFKVVAGSVQDVESTNGVVVNTSLLKAIGTKNQASTVNTPLTVKVVIPAVEDGAKDTAVTRDFKIGGVVETGAGAELYIPAKTFESEGVTSATQAKLLALDRSQVANIRKQIENQGFTTASPIDTIDQINQIFNLLNVVLVGFGGIGMVIAILGMFNTLTISLLERTKEFGLMISLGARSRDVRRLFVVEALALSVMGGLFGILAAFILGVVVNLAVNGFARGRGVSDTVSLFALSPELIVATLVFVAVLGYIVVLYPAYRASHTNPVDSMRRD
jgi:putative ABC transport system permease protein